VTKERIGRFFKNLASALGHSIFEDAEVLEMVSPRSFASLSSG
jgi:hypothetical protein